MRKNSQFHISIYSFADSPLLLEMIERLMARVGPYVYTYAIAGQDNSRILKHHGNMFQGLVERNKNMITEALREDLKAAAHIILPALEQKSQKEKN